MSHSMPPTKSIASDATKMTLNTLQPLVRLLAISHREIETVVADALGRCLRFLTDAEWQELGMSNNKWRILFMSLMYLLRDDGGAATGDRGSVVGIM
ncbi:BQ2448_3223 [Microbotryum intermedium]|uniref:BQ2448_3223 protein n=1 Tax=Microbotryum intermedium TaxID=269621 RepID=A0A238FEL6_9BASI|nr:BQ2448_3223 [Microbotryum intermedium]